LIGQYRLQPFGAVDLATRFGERRDSVIKVAIYP